MPFPDYVASHWRPSAGGSLAGGLGCGKVCVVISLGSRGPVVSERPRLLPHAGHRELPRRVALTEVYRSGTGCPADVHLFQQRRAAIPPRAETRGTLAAA